MKKTAVFIGLICLIGLIWPGDVEAASFSLSPATANLGVGDTIAVDIVVDTGTDAVSGATAILYYNTALFSVQDDDATAAGIQIKQGTIFNQSPLINTVDAGTIRYDSGSLGTTYSGRGVMATINFRALAPGTSLVTFVFDPNLTNDTSIVAAASGPTNLLTAVNDGTYIIGGGGVPVVTPLPVVNYPPQQVSLPPTGLVENTIAALLGGIFLIGAGFYIAKNGQR